MVREFQARTGTLYFRDVPKDDRAAFHAACTKKGWSMKRVILKFIKDFANSSEGLDWNQSFYPLHSTPKKKGKKGKKK